MYDTELNESQKIAVGHFKGPMLVLAGPGSGKTTVVIHRVKNLIQKHGVAPANILVITFTKAAAVEMETRFYALGVQADRGVTFGTFHSLFFRILRQAYGYDVKQIIAEEEKWTVLRTIIREMELEINDEEEYIKSFLSELSVMKNNLIELRNYNSINFPVNEFKQIYKKYDAYKERTQKLDFDDMLTQCYELLKFDETVLKKWQNKFQYLLVDEYQDINRVQYECIKLLSQPENNLFVVGDDDQSIYRFRGAKPEFLLQFPKEYNAKTVLLNVNYRSSDVIIRLGAKIIGNNKKRFEKEMTGTEKAGCSAVFFSEEDFSKEAAAVAKKITRLLKKGIPHEEIAVIFRTNLQAGSIARALLDAGIPYYLKDTIANLYEHWITQDFIAYLMLAVQNENNGAFLKILNKPKRYISKDFIKQVSKKSTGSLLEAMLVDDELKKWQARHLIDLKQHLVQIKKRKPYEAIKYIRNVVGYDEYIAEYAKFRKMNPLALKEIASEIMDAAKEIETVEGYLERLKTLSQEMKENKKRSAKPAEHAVTVSTMHSAKGLEFEAVFIPGIVEGILPHEKSVTPEEVEEERRLLYVGITRAKQFLYLSEYKTRFEKNTARSRFLQELGIKTKPNKKSK